MSNTIKTTAADFCNGSLASDKNRLFCSESITTLVNEAMESVTAINAAQPDDQCELVREDFVKYYQSLEADCFSDDGELDFSDDDEFDFSESDAQREIDAPQDLVVAR